MVKKFSSAQHKQNFAPSQDDWNLIQKLQAKLGLKFSDIVRLALRRLAEMEELDAKSRS
jgi:hypothetical protein